MTSKVRKRTSRDTENEKKRGKFMLYLKKTMVKSVIYLLFSYQTGYIMWHSRRMIYIPFGCASGNIDPKPTLSDSWLTYNNVSILYCCNCWYNYECIFVIAPWGTLIGIKILILILIFKNKRINCRFLKIIHCSNNSVTSEKCIT
jgi:ABC-type phosphate/phosphonate transport system permease subunit